MIKQSVKIAVLISLFAIAFSACNKHGNPPELWDEINGVYLKDSLGINIGTMGTPNVFTEDSSLKLSIFENPNVGIPKFELVNKLDVDLSYTLELFAAEYINMPNSLPSNIGQGAIPVQNRHYGPFRVTEYGGSIPGGSSLTTLAVDTSLNLSQGFYKLLITTSEGKKYWDNIWIYRP